MPCPWPVPERDGRHERPHAWRERPIEGILVNEPAADLARGCDAVRPFVAMAAALDPEEWSFEIGSHGGRSYRSHPRHPDRSSITTFQVTHGAQHRVDLLVFEPGGRRGTVMGMVWTTDLGEADDVCAAMLAALDRIRELAENYDGPARHVSNDGMHSPGADAGHDPVSRAALAVAAALDRTLRPGATADMVNLATPWTPTLVEHDGGPTLPLPEPLGSALDAVVPMIVAPMAQFANNQYCLMVHAQMDWCAPFEGDPVMTGEDPVALMRAFATLADLGFDPNTPTNPENPS